MHASHLCHVVPVSLDAGCCGRGKLSCDRPQGITAAADRGSVGLWVRQPGHVDSTDYLRTSVRISSVTPATPLGHHNGAFALIVPAPHLYHDRPVPNLSWGEGSVVTDERQLKIIPSTANMHYNITVILAPEPTTAAYGDLQLGRLQLQPAA